MQDAGGQTMRVVTIAKNIFLLGVFYVVICLVLYNYHLLLTSRISVPINSGRLATEFLSIVFPSIVVPYSSVLSGYFTAIAHAEVKTPSI
jgi:hypothetical protein